MAKQKVRLTDALFREVVQKPSVRAALLAKAKDKQARAEGIAASEDVELKSRVTQGTRPQGRPYARVESPNVGQEWGDGIVERKRILGRAAEGS